MLGENTPAAAEIGEEAAFPGPSCSGANNSQALAKAARCSLFWLSRADFLYLGVGEK